MNKINNINCGIGQTSTTPQPLRDKDSKETRTSREIDFSKWFGEHGSESISIQERASGDRLIANHTESTFCALNPDHQKPPLSQAVTCSQTEPDPWTMRMEHKDQAFLEKVLEGDYSEPSNLLLEKVLEDDYSELSNLLDESDLPSSSPCPYSTMASNLDHQKPSLSQAVTCSQTEPDPWAMAFVEKVLEGGYSEPSNLLDESDLPSSSPCPYSTMASNLDHQKPPLSQAVTCSQTEPDLSTMGHKEWALVEPLLSTKGESTANRKLQPEPTSNEECDLMTDDQSDLDHQGPCPRQAVRHREAKPELWSISDKEWNMVEPLFNKEVTQKGYPRKTLNSLLFILINGDSTPFPNSLNFSTKRTARECFPLFQANKVFEEVLPVLEKESQEPLQSHYRKLLENLQKISNSETKPLSVSYFNKKFGQAGSGFQCVTDRQWRLIKPLLNKKIIKCGGHDRRDLNSIFSVIMNGVHIDEISLNPNFSRKSNFYRCFAAWKKDETLKKVLNRLIKEAQGTVRSNYQKVLYRLEEGLSLNRMQRLAHLETVLNKT